MLEPGFRLRYELKNGGSFFFGTGLKFRVRFQAEYKKFNPNNDPLNATFEIYEDMSVISIYYYWQQ